MSNDFDGKVALVTAAASGIGLATAKAFARRGAQVVLSDLNEEEGQKQAALLKSQGHSVCFVSADACNEADICRLLATTLDQFGTLDYAANIVGNALGDANGPVFHSKSVGGWDATIETCMRSTYLCMKHEIAHMIDYGGGSIVNVSSLSGLVYVPESGIAYSAAKAAIIQMTKFAAITYAENNIRVNCIAPGVTPTPAYYRRGEEAGNTQIKNMVNRQAIKRAIDPDEQATSILWLCGDDASMVTGHTLPVDGGWAAY